MSRSKRAFAALLIAALLVCGLPPAVFAAGTPGFSFGVTAFPEEGASTLVNAWFSEREGRFYLFLPAFAGDGELPVTLSGVGAVSLDGDLLVSGKKALFTDGAHTLFGGGKSYPLTVLRSRSYPAVFLSTASGSLDKLRASKSYQEAGALTVIENGTAVLSAAELKSVKGRGNSTWAADKKPFNIKFEKKTDLLGMGKAKKWSLLANHFDYSLLRNSVAFDLAAAFGLPFPPAYRMVDLYANGEYQGNYLIVESVEVGENRVEIEDLEDANEEANPGTDVEAAPLKSETLYGLENARRWADIAAPSDVRGGYLLETEFPARYLDEASGFITPRGQRVVLKSPEYAAKAEVTYVASLWEEMERALWDKDGVNEKGRSYASYFETDALTKMYILTEFTAHRDAGMSSCDFYKSAGSDLLHAGPAWDFDLSLGSARYNAGLPFDVSDPSLWWANALFYGGEEKTPAVFTLLYRHEDFRDRVKTAWPALAAKLEGEAARLPGMIDAAVPSAVMNALRWGLLSGTTPEEKAAAYRKEAERVLTYVKARRTALDKGFAADAAMVYYDANGGTGRLYHGKILSVGDMATLREITHAVTPLTAPEGCTFAGWSLSPDGKSGVYPAGARVTLTGRTTVFYAVWKPVTVGPRFPTEEDGEYALGDIDLDLRVTAADARLALREAVGLETLSAPLRDLADANRDGRIAAADARSILRAAVELETLPDVRILVPKGTTRSAAAP